MRLPFLTSRRDSYVSVRVPSVPTDRQLPYRLYVEVNDKKTLFRNEGDVLAGERRSHLLEHGVSHLWILSEQQKAHQEFLDQTAADESLKFEVRAVLFRERGYLLCEQILGDRPVKEILPEVESYAARLSLLVRGKPDLALHFAHLSVHEKVLYRHLINTAVYTLFIADMTSLQNPEEAALAGLLHDIGERRIDPLLTGKVDPLSRSEVKELQSHTDKGLEELRDVALPEGVRRAVNEHHENQDGSGYPGSKKREEIHPLSAIVSISDVFDALTTPHVYRRALDPYSALRLMISMQPFRFDENFFDPFHSEMKKILG